MLKNIKITQIKSSIGRLPKHKATLNCLGLKRIGHTVIKKKSPIILGMIKKIFYMIKIGN
ncbi:50S ribosomal protein L30 [Enterobacteriaceae endosymbiont of Plateumaris consimilis]|uniref:50S ribosomal protein L30 n=1 Tax=Enterobacteriaceae endosymbiont of Plateumaris consimilis TaxID=2675794 RepID=UPI001449D2D6|nr:50S ribosomal protein L30 [Enterobacteriaceae endosymbiont of Plateumaris consimilis]QJC28672.1 50S ribosomal protein L30 [Enterobacteriaceae endosymbiont of Plateumaris consimilis]